MSWRTSVELIADRESNDCKHPANGWTKLLFGIWAGTPHVPIMNSGSDRTWRHKSRGPVLIYLFNHRSGIPAQYGIHDGKYAINIPEFRTIYRLEFSNKTSGLELRCVTNVLIIPSPPPSSPPHPRHHGNAASLPNCGAVHQIRISIEMKADETHLSDGNESLVNVAGD